MLEKFDALFNKIISEELNQTDKNIVDNIINKLTKIRNDKDLNILNRNKVKEIFHRLNSIESFGKINFTEDELKDKEKQKAKIEKMRIKSHLLNSLEQDGVKITKALNDTIIKTHHKCSIIIPSIENFSIDNKLYIFDINKHKYVEWEDVPTSKDIHLSENHLFKIPGNTKYLSQIFNSSYAISGDIIGNGELLAEHIFSNFILPLSHNERIQLGSNRKIDGYITNSTIAIDVKHTLKFKSGVQLRHKDEKISYIDDHYRKLKKNVLYLIFDFNPEQISYALVYYHHK